MSGIARAAAVGFPIQSLREAVDSSRNVVGNVTVFDTDTLVEAARQNDFKQWQAAKGDQVRWDNLRDAAKQLNESEKKDRVLHYTGAGAIIVIAAIVFVIGLLHLNPIMIGLGIAGIGAGSYYLTNVADSAMDHLAAVNIAAEETKDANWDKLAAMVRQTTTGNDLTGNPEDFVDDGGWDDDFPMKQRQSQLDLAAASQDGLGQFPLHDAEGEDEPQPEEFMQPDPSTASLPGAAAPGNQMSAKELALLKFMGTMVDSEDPVEPQPTGTTSGSQEGLPVVESEEW